MMNADISLKDRLGLHPSTKRAEFQFRVLMPFFAKIGTDQFDDDFLSDMEEPCSKYNLTPQMVLNAILLDNNVFDILEIPPSKYNLQDSFIKKAGHVYTENELLQVLERRFPYESMGFRITNSTFGEINIVCKDTNAISTITMECIHGLSFYVISTIHYGIGVLPEAVVHQMNMTTNLIKWDVDQFTCFTLLPNPEYTPTEAADYVIAHNNMIKAFQSKGIM